MSTHGEIVASHVVLGAGPVGRAVVAALNTRGITPVVVTRGGTAVAGATIRRADVNVPPQAAAAGAGAQVIFHCVQPPYHRWPQEFPALQASVVAAAGAAGALLVVAESLYGYGPSGVALTEDMPLAATTRKGTVRAAMHRDLEAAHEDGRLRMVVGRASDFFGPGVDASAVGNRFFGPLVKGKAAPQTIRVVGDPDRRHTYTYVADFGEALVRLAEDEGSWGRAWHVPNAPTVTTRVFATAAADVAGTQLKLRAVKPWMLRIAGVFQPAAKEVIEMLYEFEHDFVVDDTAYATRFGQHATPLRDALAATVAAARATAVRNPGAR